MSHDAPRITGLTLDAVAGVVGRAPVRVSPPGEEEAWEVRFVNRRMKPRMAALTVRLGRVVDVETRRVPAGTRVPFRELVAGVA